MIQRSRNHNNHLCYSLLIRIFKLFLLFCSILSGVLFAVVWRNYEQAVLRINTIHSPISRSNIIGNHPLTQNDLLQKLDDKLQHSETYEQWLDRNFHLESVPIPREDLSYDLENTTQKFMLESEFLAKQVKVSCMILSTTRTRSRALNNTWTRHCNQRMFYGLHHEMKIPWYMKLNSELDDLLLSPRTFCHGFIDMLDRMVENDSKWLLITTDSTYALIENIRYMVAPLNATDRFYIGRPVHHYFLGVYNSFDSGILLSRGTVDLLANTLFINRSACLHLATNSVVYGGQFDSYIGMHLDQYGVRPSNSLDKKTGGNGGTRFHPFMPEKHLNPKLISVFDTFWTSNFLPIVGGLSCCSNRAITFTGFSPVTMYFIEYVLYHLAAYTEFDGQRKLANLPPPYRSYQVPSDLDDQKLVNNSQKKQDDFITTTDIIDDQHHHHHHHHRRRKRRKHRKNNNKTLNND